MPVQSGDGRGPAPVVPLRGIRGGEARQGAASLPLAEDVTENLGEYESEARAMEVLEDIARQYKHHTRTTQRNALMFAFEPPKVYEMPLE